MSMVAISPGDDFIVIETTAMQVWTGATANQ
jgi:hypothetical protein